MTQQSNIHTAATELVRILSKRSTCPCPWCGTCIEDIMEAQGRLAEALGIDLDTYHQEDEECSDDLS